MGLLSGQAVDEWEASLGEVEGLLDFDSWGIDEGITTASGKEVAVADEVEPYLSRFEAQSEARERDADGIDDIAERNRVLSTLAVGDIEAAFVAAELARTFEDGGAETASWDPPTDAAGIASELGNELRGATAPENPAPDPAWLAKLNKSLSKVVDESAAGILRVGTTAATATVAASLGNALAEVASGALGQLIDSAKKELKRLKKKVMDLLKRAASKIAKLFGSDVQQAVGEWIQDQLDELPSRLVGAAAGVTKTVTAWQKAAGAGTKVDELVAKVEPMEESKLNTLKWAGRGVKVYGYVAPTLLTMQLTGVPSSVVVGALALALVGWMLWAAIDHSHDVRKLAV